MCDTLSYIIMVIRTIRVFTWCARLSGAGLHHGRSGLIAARGAGRLVGAEPHALQYPVSQSVLFARRRTLEKKKTKSLDVFFRRTEKYFIMCTQALLFMRFRTANFILFCFQI